MSVVTNVEAQVFHPYPVEALVGKSTGTTANEVINLQAGALRRLKGDHRWRIIICVRGMIWVTQECDWRDYVLTPGDIFVVTQKGQVLIEALEDASMEITPSLRAVPYKGNYALFD